MSEFTIDIKKAKIIDGGTRMEIEYEQKITAADGETLACDVVKVCKYEPHPDLLEKFAELRPHLVALCEEELPTAQVDEKGEMSQGLSKFKVTGFIIGGSGEHEGVTLVGCKKLAHKRVLNLVAPFTKWQDEHNGYDGAFELLQAVRACQAEVIAYLGGKMKPHPQKEFDFGGEEN